jgi:hypothetical protein
MRADEDGVIRIRCFPGLWIDEVALRNKDRRLLQVLEEGLASPEHTRFVRRLAQARTKFRRKSS